MKYHSHEDLISDLKSISETYPNDTEVSML